MLSNQVSIVRTTDNKLTAKYGEINSTWGLGEGLAIVVNGLGPLPYHHYGLCKMIYRQGGEHLW